MTTPDDQETYHLFGNLLTFKAGPEQTGGAFSLFECVSAPGAGAPPNRHPEDEAFLVLDGRFECTIEGDTRVVGPGDFVKVPRNAVHTFHNIGDAPARMLVFNWPGHDHVAFFRDTGERMPAGTTTFPEMTPPDPAAMAAVGARHNMEFLPPGGGAA